MNWRRLFLPTRPRRTYNRPGLQTHRCPICHREVEVVVHSETGHAFYGTPAAVMITDLDRRAACPEHGDPPWNKWTVLKDKGELPPLYRDE